MLSVILLLLLALTVAAQEFPRQTAERSAASAERLAKELWVAGNGAKALAEYEQALRIWRALGEQKQEATILLRLAQLHLALNSNCVKAKEFAAQGLERSRALGDASIEASALGVMAWCESGADFAGKGRPLFEQALARARQGRARDAEVQTLHSFALALSNHGEAEKALELLDQALPLARQLRDTGQEAGVNFIYGIAYWHIGDYEKSLFHYEQAHQLFTASGNLIWATTAVENAALVYNLLEQPEKVLECYREALPFRRQTQQITALADNLTNLAAALVKLNRLPAAAENLREALALYEQTKNPWGQAWAWRITGELHLTAGDYDQAARFSQDSRQLQAQLNEQNGVAKATYLLARAHLAQGRLDEARRHAEELLTMVEAQRAGLSSPDLRLAFLSARRDYYELYLSVLSRLHAVNPNAGHDLAALEASERARARSLFELIAGRPNAAVPNAAEMQSLLDDNTALLAYTLGRRASFLFVVTKDGVRLVDLPPAAQVESLVQDVQDNLATAGRRNYARFVLASQRLYEILLKPAGRVLEGRKSLVIAPDAALNYLPFEVLLTNAAPRTGRADFQKLPFALRRWTISYTPSASVLAEVKRKHSNIPNLKSEIPKPTPQAHANLKSEIPKPTPQAHANPQSAIRNPQSETPQFIAFADPLYNTADNVATNRVRRLAGPVLPRLMESSREVNRIAADFGATAQVFLRHTATEQNVKQCAGLSQARIIHFATHGTVNERLPQFSGLWLGAEGAEDGLLQADEIYNLKLNADLVVLSACRTALGKHLRGEGVMGLTRAFLSAGAASVAATLWQVEDTATADLMIDFYAQLKTAPDKAAALRQAKLAMLKNERLAHPYFWASFILIGEP